MISYFSLFDTLPCTYTHAHVIFTGCVHCLRVEQYTVPFLSPKVAWFLFPVVKVELDLLFPVEQLSIQLEAVDLTVITLLAKRQK